MNKNITWKLLSVMSLLIAAGTFGWFILEQKKQQVVFVNLGQVFSEFKFTKDVEKQLMKLQEPNTNTLDSLNFLLKSNALQMEQRQIESNGLEEMQRDIRMKMAAIENQNRQYVDHYDQLIWSKINELMEEFGRANDYEFILGSTGEGNLMFANEKNNVTSEVISYLNTEYEKEK